MNRKPLLIVGLPRSGTTWIGEIAASVRGVRYIFEPDNEKTSSIGWECKGNLHRFPYLKADNEEPQFAAFWQAVFAGHTDCLGLNQLTRLIIRRRVDGVENDIRWRVGMADGHTRFAVAEHQRLAHIIRLARRSVLPVSARIVVKSVHCVLCLEWLKAHFAPQIVLVLRNPYSLVASYKRMGLPDGDRNLLVQSQLQRDLEAMGVPATSILALGEERVGAQLVDRLAIQIAISYRVLNQQLRFHPDWIVCSHDELCRNPLEGFRRLMKQCSLDWDAKVEARILQLERPGQGFNPSRIAHTQANKWRDELSDDEQARIAMWMTRYGVDEFIRSRITEE